MAAFRRELVDDVGDPGGSDPRRLGIGIRVSDPGALFRGDRIPELLTSPISANRREEFGVRPWSEIAL